MPNWQDYKTQLKASTRDNQLFLLTKAFGLSSSNLQVSKKPFDQLTVAEMQHKISSWLQSTFTYWLGKNEANGFLHLDDFKRKMVMFGLSPSYEFMTSAIENYKLGLRIPSKTFDRKGGQRQYDDSFIYDG